MISKEQAATALKALGTLKKAKRIGTVMGVALVLVLLICIVGFIVINTAYADEDYIRLSPSMKRNYNTSVFRDLLLAETKKQDAILDLKVTTAEIISSNENVDLDIEDILKETPGINTSLGFTEDYATVNNRLRAYLNKVCKWDTDINGNKLEFDSLLYMALCNTESCGWMADFSECVSSVYPAKLIDDTFKLTADNCDSMFASLSTGMVYSNISAYHISATNTGTPWMMVDNYKTPIDDTDQGPATQRFDDVNGSNVDTMSRTFKTWANEYAQFMGPNRSKYEMLMNDAYGSNLFDRVTTYCTGGSTAAASYGDRFNLLDGGAYYRRNMLEAIQGVKKQLDYYDIKYVNNYSVVMYARMAWWLPAWTHDQTTTADKMYHLVEYLSQPKCIAIIRKHAEDDAKASIMSTTMGKIKGGWKPFEQIYDEIYNQATEEERNNILDLSACSGSQALCNGAYPVTRLADELIGFTYHYMVLETWYGA